MPNRAINDALTLMMRQFADQLPARIAAIQAHLSAINIAAWKRDEAETLHRTVHSLTGAAGTFGMASVSDSARHLESLLVTLIARGDAPIAEEWQTILQAQEDLLSVANRRLGSDAPSLVQQVAMQGTVDGQPIIHLVEDDPAQARFLAEELKAGLFQVQVFATIDEFRREFRSNLTERPAAVVMDMVFPEGDDAGAHIISELGLGQLNGTPVVFISVRDDLPARLIALRAGASRYMTKPFKSERLLRLLEYLTGRKPPAPYRILLVDDDESLLEMYSVILRHQGMKVHAETRPLNALEALKSFQPDVVILDMYMPDASGAELAAVIREQDIYAQTPILFLSAELDMDKQLLALNLGGDDFLIKPIAPAHLIAAVTARARRARQSEATNQNLQVALYEREREHLAVDKHALVSVADRAGLITYANDAFCEVSGYQREELMGNDHRMINSGTHPAEFFRDMWTTLRSGNIWRGEICNRRKDGRLYWVSATLTPFLDRDGKVYQYVAIRTDITRMKESQEELTASKERLEEAQTLAHMGNWRVEPNSDRLYWSEEIYRIFGRDRTSFVPTVEAFHAAIHPATEPW